eukprot:scaffold276_cov116-Isochrysis_galbana.AAC.21
MRYAARSSPLTQRGSLQTRTRYALSWSRAQASSSGSGPHESQDSADKKNVDAKKSMCEPMRTPRRPP